MSARDGTREPPRWATRVAGLRLPADRREFVLGDLAEEFKERSTSRGRRDAVRWYWRQAWRSALGRHPRLLGPLAPSEPRRRVLAVPPILHDVRYALRGLRQQPGFAAAAVLTLALGIGANAAVFRVAWQVILKPLPYPHADRLVRVWEAYAQNGRDQTNTVAPGNFVDWQRDTRTFDGLAAYNAFRSTVDLTGTGDPAQLDVRMVTGGYFSVFGMAPLLGRTLTDADMRAADSTAVLSEALWRQRFGSDARVVGRTIRLSGDPYTVVGVMPAAFGLAAGSTIDAWLGMSLPPAEAANHGGHYLGLVARLKPGVTVEQAIADVKAAARQDSLLFPDSNKDTSATVVTLDAERGGTLRSAIALLAGAAGLVLLIACANLASLQLARGLARGREFGIRAALGASRSRLMLQLLIESLVIATLGAGAGLAVSSWTLGMLAHVAPQSLRAGAAAGVDLATLGCAAALALISVVLFAVAPAWRSASGGRRWTTERAVTSDRRTAAARTALVVGQLGLAVILLVSATLLVTSLSRVLRVDPGFDPSGVLTFDLSLPDTRYPTFEARRQLFDRVFRELTSIPGVTAVCGINAVPFDQTFNMTYVPEGRTDPVGAWPRTVTPGCFDTLRLRLVAGRLFTAHETTRVGIVTERFAHIAWGNTSPVGRRVHVGVATGDLIDIVGVVTDSLQSSLEAKPYPQFYETASTQNTFPPVSLLVRTGVTPASVFSAVRSAVRRVDGDQTVARLRALDQVVGTSVAERQFDLGLFGGFAIIALLLSAVGIYGLFAHIVAERRPEIGIRLALGAQPASVVGLILRRAWFAVGLGLTIGLVGADAASGVLRRFMFQLSPTDPRIYAGAAAVLGAIAIIAAWIPSHRAAAVDPVGVLRQT
jgi:putative ABC transport system permease protein